MDAATRRSNLQALIRSRYGDQQAAAAAALQLSPGRVSQLLDDAQAFGERAARRIEQSAGLPPMWLDRPIAANRADDWTPPQHAPEGVSVRPVAQDLIHTTKEDEPTTCTWEFILSGSELPPRFSAAAPDDALAPVTPRGTGYLFATSSAPPADGTVVIVQAGNGRRYMRLFFAGAGVEWEARARDPAHRALHSERDELTLLASATHRAGGQG